ncbi:MAG: cytochrome-c peroxidase, partial [Chthoniobacteraceae bacterium]
MTNPHRNILAIFGSALVLLTTTNGSQAGTLTEPEQNALRQLGTSVIGALPDKMPGSERDTPELVALGRTLFFDVRLSANNSQSCNTCHAVDRGLGGVDNEATSLGAFGQRGGRNSPTVLNAGFHVSQFWDGRAGDLAEQAKGPILNPIEMAMPSEEAVVEKLSQIPEYVTDFAKVFGPEEKPLTYDNIAKAIAAFERTLITRDRFDDFLKGEAKALNDLELQGLQTFVNVGCVSCHNGPTLGGSQFQKLGLVNPYETKDMGRYDVTKDEADKFKFKVPSLRNIAITGPYFHDGAKVTLEETIREMSWLQLGKKLEDAEVKAIRAF